MNEKQLRKILTSNMALWIMAIIMPFVIRAFSSKDAKIFDILIPMLQMTLATASTGMFASMYKSICQPPAPPVETK